jgi:hypothetical protein
MISVNATLVPGTNGTGSSNTDFRGSSGASVDMPSNMGTNEVELGARDDREVDEAEKDAFTADTNDEERALDDESVQDDADKESEEDADESSEECELSKGADATAEDDNDDEDEDEATISTPAVGRCFLR